MVQTKIVQTFLSFQTCSTFFLMRDKKKKVILLTFSVWAKSNLTNNYVDYFQIFTYTKTWIWYFVSLVKHVLLSIDALSSNLKAAPKCATLKTFYTEPDYRPLISQLCMCVNLSCFWGIAWAITAFIALYNEYSVKMKAIFLMCLLGSSVHFFVWFI